MFDKVCNMLYTIVNTLKGVSYMELRDIIKQYRIEHNLSQREFAAKCTDISNGYISIIEADFNPHTHKPPRPSMEKLTSIARGMNMTLDALLDLMNDRKTLVSPPEPLTLDRRITDLIENEINTRVTEKLKQTPVPGAETLPYTPPRAQIPVIGSVRCGPGGLALEEPMGTEGADVANAEDYFYLRAEGDSMEPQVFAGDLVLVHKQPDVESGEVAVVVLNGDEGMLKKVIKKNGAVILQSYNPAHPPRVLIGDEISALRIAGKAVQLLRKW